MPLPDILDIWFKIDRQKLRALDLPVEEISIAEIEYNLDIPYLEQEWTDGWNLTPRMLMKNFEKEKSHAEAVMACDISYPIELFLHHGKRVILDGVHRLTKNEPLKIVERSSVE